jgi:hypothetical protein
MKLCIVCNEPARLMRGMDDLYADTCSNECSVAAWNREQHTFVCVGDLTVEKIDEALSGNGWTVPGEEAQA